MGNNKENPELQIALGTRAFFSPVRSIVSGGPQLQELMEFNNGIEGSDGLHLFPFKGNMWSGFYEEKSSGILSAEQAFRSERTLWPAVKRLSTPKEAAKYAASFVLFPERIASLEPMLRYEQHVNPRLKEIIYLYCGKAERNGDDWNLQMNESQYENFEDFRNPVIRLQPELIDRLGVNSQEELFETLQAIGYTGFSVNMHHLLREPTQGFQSQFTDLGNLEGIVEYVVSKARILEVFPSLPDLGTNHKRPWVEDKAQQLMLRKAKKQHFTGEIVVSFPDGSLLPMEKSGIDVSGFLKDLRDYMYSDKS